MDTKLDAQDLSEEVDSLEQELRDWWERRNQDWESEDDDDGLMVDGGVWNHMPVIDSKEVTRAAPICEDHLNVDFDPTMVREGGYDSIDDLINHLIPRLIEEVQDPES